MPFFSRIAALDLCLGGAPTANHIRTLSDLSQFHTEVSKLYPSRGQSATANPPGYRINSLTAVIGHGKDAYRRAAHALNTGEAFELSWARFWRRGRGHRWTSGDSVVIAARLLPFIWIANVNEVVRTESRRRSVAVTWGTSARHVLRGEERVEVWQDPTGDVSFRLRSFSRPHAFVAWLTYPVVLYMQQKFAKDVFRRLKQITNRSLNTSNNDPPPVERGKPKQENLRGVRIFHNHP